MRKFNARIARRKRPCTGLSRGQLIMAVLAALFMPAAAWAEIRIPLPQPRPAAAPAPDGQDSKQASERAPATPETSSAPSACRLALTDAVAIAPSIPAITGPGACGGDDLVRLEAVVLPDQTRVPVKPAATLRCTMASAIADWIRTDMVPLAEGLGSRVSELDNFDSFECRGRNRVVGAKLSEHGRANAIDIRAVRLSNGGAIALTDRSVPRQLRERVLNSVCARFTTVLGPGSDGYHEDHIHLDLAERRNGYRICHWEIYDPMPVVAPLLPAERPAEASPRETAEAGDKTSETNPERERAPRAAPQAVPATAIPVDLVPEPRKRPAAANAAGKPARDSSKPLPSASVRSTRPSSATPVKRKRKRRTDLPPFLRQLLD